MLALERAGELRAVEATEPVWRRRAAQAQGHGQGQGHGQVAEAGGVRVESESSLGPLHEVGGCPGWAALGRRAAVEGLVVCRGPGQGALGG